jgi:hypothetical protein
MHAGAIWDERGCGVIMGKRTRAKLGFKISDYVYIESEEKGTRICRQVRGFPLKTRASSGYAYMDKDSLDLLDVELHDCIWVWKADITFEAP